MSKTVDPKTFDLDLFLKGCTPSTAFVTVYGDRRAAAELAELRKQYEQARAKENDGEGVYGVGEASPADRLEKQYEAKLAELEASKVDVEVRELLGSVRTALSDQFKEKHGVTEEEIQTDLEGLGADLDYWVLAKGIVYPPLNTPGNVKRFHEAIGDEQWAKVLSAWVDTQSADVSAVAGLKPDFLLKSSPSDGGVK